MAYRDFFNKVYHLYYDGFRQMTLGKTLWTIIIIKLFIMFAILKVFFFPDYLKQNSRSGHEAEFVGKELIQRTNH